MYISELKEKPVWQMDNPEQAAPLHPGSFHFNLKFSNCHSGGC